MQEPRGDLVQLLTSKIVGQQAALEYIVPYVQMYQAKLVPPDRPAGVFLLLGPTGTGKTRTVEALAEVLHGSAKSVLKIDCGEFQSDHEVAKLIGAPPGYLGHRETKPVLTAERLTAVTSPACGLSLVLFDEIEKAAPALSVLLLGLLDKGTLTLGDNSVVNFENSLIFFTSNLGAREMLREIQPEMGFASPEPRSASAVAGRIESVGLAAVRRRFSPEFVNRIDAVITYQPLDGEALAQILDHHIEELQRHVYNRLGERSFEIEVSAPARQLILNHGASAEHGARELKRTIHRMLTQPLATLVASNQIAPGTRVLVDVGSPDTLSLTPLEVPSSATPTVSQHPVVLVLDDNESLLGWISAALVASQFEPVRASTAAQARAIVASRAPDAALLDVILPDGDGLSLALELRLAASRMQIVLMTGGDLSSDETRTCDHFKIPVLRKPFLAADAVNLIRAKLTHVPAINRVGS